VLCLSILIELMGIANIVDPKLFLSEFKKSINSYILANKQIHRAQLDFGEFPSRFPFAIYRQFDDQNWRVKSSNFRQSVGRK